MKGVPLTALGIQVFRVKVPKEQLDFHALVELKPGESGWEVPVAVVRPTASPPLLPTAGGENGRPLAMLTRFEEVARSREEVIDLLVIAGLNMEPPPLAAARWYALGGTSFPWLDPISRGEIFRREIDWCQINARIRDMPKPTGRSRRSTGAVAKEAKERLALFAGWTDFERNVDNYLRTTKYPEIIQNEIRNGYLPLDAAVYLLKKIPLIEGPTVFAEARNSLCGELRLTKKCLQATAARLGIPEVKTPKRNMAFYQSVEEVWAAAAPDLEEWG